MKISQIIRQSPADHVSTVLGLGHIPKAPGTWGSIPGLFISMFYGWCWVGLEGSQGLFLPLNALIGAVLLLGLGSITATHFIAKTETEWNSHDDKRIVIDEVLGQMVATIWFVPSPMMLLTGFILFRFFDILKPGPIGWVDKSMHSPFSTLLDDLIAGGFAAVVLALGHFVIH